MADIFSQRANQKLNKTNEEVLEKIEKISLWLAQARTLAFYLEKDYAEQDAKKASEDAAFVLAEVRKLLESNP